MTEVLDDFILRTAIQGRGVLEQRIRILLRPRPRWLPERVWRLVLSRLLWLEIDDTQRLSR